MDFLFDGPEDARATLVLTHGAGTPMDHPSLEGIAKLVAARGIRVARFEFPYMAARRTSASRRPPDREPVLRATWLAAIRELSDTGPFDKLRASGTVIGGRSMGGRIA